MYILHEKTFIFNLNNGNKYTLPRCIFTVLSNES